MQGRSEGRSLLVCCRRERSACSSARRLLHRRAPGRCLPAPRMQVPMWRYSNKTWGDKPYTMDPGYSFDCECQ